MSIACHLVLPPFLFCLLAIFFGFAILAVTIFAVAILFAAFATSFKFEIWGLLCGFESFNW